MKKLFSIIFLLLSISSAASAAIITYKHEGTGAGSIGGTAFSASAFTITATADTANIQSCGGVCLSNDHLSATITIDGVGTFTFSTGTRTFFNNDNVVGFSRASTGGADLFNGPTSALLSGWNMATSIGPIQGTGSLLQWSNTPVINTDGGVLNFTSSTGPAIFTATVVPEPSTYLLMGLGLLGLGFMSRKRKSGK